MVSRHHAEVPKQIKESGAVVYKIGTNIPLDTRPPWLVSDKAYMTVSDFKKYATKINMKVTVNGETKQDEDQILQNASNKIKLRDRNEAVLLWLTNNGHDPKKLAPLKKDGLGTVKCICCVALLSNTQLFPDIDKFDRTWERLRKNGKIKNTPPPHHLFRHTLL